jgi:hypothetical protein
MNRIVEEFRRDDERILDKLVDGELTETDRKVLLSALDDEPGAWRRCALAFLEAQTWRGDFTQLLAGSALSSIEKAVGIKSGDSKASSAQVSPASAAIKASTSVQSGASHAASSPFAPSRVMEYAMALAACLLVAFGLGIWARGAWQDTNGFAGQGASQFAHGGSAFAPATTTVQSPGTWQGTTVNSGLSGLPQLSSSNSSTVELTPQAEQMLQQTSPGISDAMRESLEKAGHRVIHTKQLVPVELPDGRRALMPVDQVDVEPNVRPAY